MLFTYISNTWHLITVPNMNKVNPFFSERSQQIHKMYETLATIAQVWQRAKCMSNVLDLINVPDMKTKIHSSLRDHSTFKIYEKMTIISQNLAQIQIVFYMHQQPMVPDQGTQYEGNPSRYHGGMREDGLTDWTLSYIPQFR